MMSVIKNTLLCGHKDSVLSLLLNEERNLLFSASEVFFSNKNIVVFLLMSGERKLHP
jgi:hypothetical protein